MQFAFLNFRLSYLKANILTYLYLLEGEHSNIARVVGCFEARRRHGNGNNQKENVTRLTTRLSSQLAATCLGS